jgi:hypothetical protein
MSRDEVLQDENCFIDGLKRRLQFPIILYKEEKLCVMGKRWKKRLWQEVKEYVCITYLSTVLSKMGG